jgi:Fe-S-cluster containining protein
MASCLCDQCAGLCCRYFALPIDNPEDKRDYDNIRWYLLHDKVVIFVESEQWYIGILTRCKALQPDNRCGIYETRPAICRSYSTDNCDYHAGDYGYDQLFTSPEALWDYARKKLREDRAAGKVKAKKKKSKATRARQLSRKLPIPPDSSGGAVPPPVTNGRSIPLKLLGSR